jgi:hypothetical protein
MRGRDLTVLVPVLNRPQRVAPTIDAFEATVPDARILFLADSDDREEIAAVEADWRADLELCEPGTGYGPKINRGAAVTDSPLLFLGADDLEPQPGWFETACAHLEDGVQVVGVNDMLPRDAPWPTAFVVTAEYAQLPAIDGKPGPLASVYRHGPCDHELVVTATHRGVFAYAEDAHVRHLHPRWGLADWDSTYMMGERSLAPDWRVWEERRARFGL